MRRSTNSQPSLVADYREKFPWCEAYPVMCEKRRHDGCHIHHIAHQGIRCDRVGNIIHLCGEAHQWCHKHPVDGTLFCLARKLEKNELSEADWNCGSVKRMLGYLLSVESRVVLARKEWERLVMWLDQE